MAVSDERLNQILTRVQSLCRMAKGNPIASVVLSSRDWLRPHWITCITSNSRFPFARSYIKEGEIEDKIYIYLPSKIEDINHCRQITSTAMFELARILLSHYKEQEGFTIPLIKYPNEFVKGFSLTAVESRGFVASRVRHTAIGLKHICSDFFSERSHFLENIVLKKLREFLGWQDRE